MRPPTALLTIFLISIGASSCVSRRCKCPELPVLPRPQLHSGYAVTLTPDEQAVMQAEDFEKIEENLGMLIRWGKQYEAEIKAYNAER